MPSNEFKIAVCRQLCLPVTPSSSLCSFCSNSILDIFGDHILCCGSSSDRINRHNSIRHINFHSAIAAGLNPALELRDLLNDSHRRPGDICIPDWSQGKMAAIDVTIVSSLQSNTIIRAAEEAEVAALAAEEAKHRSYNIACRNMGLLFIPVTAETSGGWSKNLHCFFMM